MNSSHRSNNHPLSRQQPQRSLSTTISQDSLQLKSLRSQLTFMLKENDYLRRDVKSLNRSLQQSQSAILDLSTSMTAPAIDQLNNEISCLHEQLQQITMERDESNKEVLLLKQVSMFYKYKDDEEQKEIQNRLFTQDQLIKKKDNIIKTLEQQIEVLKNQEEQRGIKIVEKYILEPSEWNMKFQKELNRLKRIPLLEKQNSELQRINLQTKMKIDQQNLKINTLKLEVEKCMQIIEVLQSQIYQLKSMKAKMAQDFTKIEEQSKQKGHKGSQPKVPIQQQQQKQEKDLENEMALKIQSIMKQFDEEKKREVKRMEEVIMRQEQLIRQQQLEQYKLEKQRLIEQNETQSLEASKQIPKQMLNSETSELPMKEYQKKLNQSQFGKGPINQNEEFKSDLGSGVQYPKSQQPTSNFEASKPLSFTQSMNKSQKIKNEFEESMKKQQQALEQDQALSSIISESVKRTVEEVKETFPFSLENEDKTFGNITTKPFRPNETQKLSSNFAQKYQDEFIDEGSVQAIFSEKDITESQNHFKYKEIIPPLNLNILPGYKVTTVSSDQVQPPEQPKAKNKTPTHQMQQVVQQNPKGVNQGFNEVQKQVVVGGLTIPDQEEGEDETLNSGQDKKLKELLDYKVTETIPKITDPKNMTQENQILFSQGQIIRTENFNQTKSDAKDLLSNGGFEFEEQAVTATQALQQDGQVSERQEVKIEPKRAMINGRSVVVVGDSSSSRDGGSRRPTNQNASSFKIVSQPSNNQIFQQQFQQNRDDESVEEYIEEEVEEEEDSPVRQNRQIIEERVIIMEGTGETEVIIIEEEEEEDDTPRQPIHAQNQQAQVQNQQPLKNYNFASPQQPQVMRGQQQQNVQVLSQERVQNLPELSQATEVIVEEEEEEEVESQAGFNYNQTPMVKTQPPPKVPMTNSFFGSFQNPSPNPMNQTQVLQPKHQQLFSSTSDVLKLQQNHTQQSEIEEVLIEEEEEEEKDDEFQVTSHPPKIRQAFGSVNNTQRSEQLSASNKIVNLQQQTEEYVQQQEEEIIIVEEEEEEETERLEEHNIEKIRQQVKKQGFVASFNEQQKKQQEEIIHNETEIIVEEEEEEEPDSPVEQPRPIQQNQLMSQPLQQEQKPQIVQQQVQRPQPIRQGFLATAEIEKKQIVQQEEEIGEYEEYVIEEEAEEEVESIQ